MTRGPILITSPNLSYAWAKAFDLSMSPGCLELPQLIVRIDLIADVPSEDPAIRAILDRYLLAGSAARQKCETVAKTVFPFTLRRSGQTRKQLYETFLKILPQLKKCRANARGMYFERMINYRPKIEGAADVEPVNQLEKVIVDLCSDRPRRSGLQLAIFDPTQDHIHNPYLRFPCLQQVSFSIREGDGMTMLALYPMHFLYERAYGNYLGLVKLGEYVSQESGRRLVQVTCVADVAKRDLKKADASPLHKEILTYVHDRGGFEALGTYSHDMDR